MFEYLHGLYIDIGVYMHVCQVNIGRGRARAYGYQEREMRTHQKQLQYAHAAVTTAKVVFSCVYSFN